MVFDPNLPYQDLPPLPPNISLHTQRLYRMSIAATQSLALLNGVSQTLPDPSMLINIIPVLEAQASSEIEQIVTTTDELFKSAYADINSITPQAKEALRYRSALHAGFELIKQRPLQIPVIATVASILNGVDTDIRRSFGTFIGSSKTKSRIYTPPEGEAVIRDHLSRWVDFIHSNDEYDPLIQVALSHYQFEAIHPFRDGNGRTGRILMMLLLIHYNQLQLPVLYLSGYLIRNKDEYYSLLRAVTEQNAWEDWVFFILKGIKETADWTLTLIAKSNALRAEVEDEIRRLTPNIPAADVTKVLFTQPYVRAQNLIDLNLVKTRQTAAKWLNELANLGVIHVEKVGRTNIFVNYRWLQLLNEHTPASF